MSICDKLNELIEKKGGKPIKNGTISEAVDALVDLDGSSGGGGGKQLVIEITNPNFGSDAWNMIEAKTSMTWVDVKSAVVDGSLSKVSVLECVGDEYGAKISAANIRSASLDDGMSFSLCIDYICVNHSGGSSVTVNNYSIIWSENGSMTAKYNQVL